MILLVLLHELRMHVYVAVNLLCIAASFSGMDKEANIICVRSLVLTLYLCIFFRFEGGSKCMCMKL